MNKRAATCVAGPVLEYKKSSWQEAVGKLKG